MMRGRPVAIVSVLLLLLTYLLIKSRSPGQAFRARAQNALQALQLSDAALNRAVLMTRAGLLLHYDSLPQVDARALARAPGPRTRKRGAGGDRRSRRRARDAGPHRRAVAEAPPHRALHFGQRRPPELDDILLRTWCSASAAVAPAAHPRPGPRSGACPDAVRAGARIGRSRDGGSGGRDDPRGRSRREHHRPARGSRPDHRRVSAAGRWRASHHSDVAGRGAGRSRAAGAAAIRRCGRGAGPALPAAALRLGAGAARLPADLSPGCGRTRRSCGERSCS